MKDTYGGMPPFVSGSETSEKASSRAKESASSMRERVHRHLEACGERGSTDDELEVALGLLHQTASARRRELELMGRVVKTDRERKTRTGSAAAVYCSEDSARPHRQTTMFAIHD